MSNNLREQIQQQIAAFGELVEAHLSAWSKARTPVEFREMELDVAKRCRQLSDGIVLPQPRRPNGAAPTSIGSPSWLRVFRALPESSSTCERGRRSGPRSVS